MQGLGHSSLKSTKGLHTVQDTNGTATNTSYIFPSTIVVMQIITTSYLIACPESVVALLNYKHSEMCSIKYIALSLANVHQLCNKFN